MFAYYGKTGKEVRRDSKQKGVCILDTIDTIVIIEVCSLFSLMSLYVCLKVLNVNARYAVSFVRVFHFLFMDEMIIKAHSTWPSKGEHQCQKYHSCIPPCRQADPDCVTTSSELGLG